MADGNYTPSQIDKFTLADANCLFNEWARLPPVRLLVASFMGVKSTPPKATVDATATTSVAQLRAMFPDDGLMKG